MMTKSELLSEIYYLNLELYDVESELLAAARGYPGCYSDIVLYIKVEQLLTELKIAQQHLDILNKT